MGFADDIVTDGEQTRAMKVQCTVTRAISNLKPADREAAVKALADGSVMHSTLARVLTQYAKGVKVTSQSVSRHRRGDCACPR